MTARPESNLSPPLIAAAVTELQQIMVSRAAEAEALEQAVRVEVRRTAQPDTWTVWIVKGVQSFKLDYDTAQEECDWYARMLRKALGIE